MRIWKIIGGVVLVALLVAAGFAWGYSVGSPGYRLSPTDTTSLETPVGSVEVTYARPYARQRKVFGEVVKYGRVWRTGANEATLLRTDTDLVFAGEQRLPAGEYSLFTLPEPESLILIVNAQTGQWGTQYDEAQDVLRVAMDFESGGAVDHVEQFTLALEPSDVGGQLVLAWERTRGTAAFRIPGMPQPVDSTPEAVAEGVSEEASSS